MRGEGGVLQMAFINFFTMKPVFPPAPVIDYSSEGASKNKLTSWAVIVSFLVSYLLIMILGILAITLSLLLVGISEGPAFSISSIMIEAVLIPMILLFIYLDGSLERTKELLRIGSFKRGLFLGLGIPVVAMIVDNIAVLIYAIGFIFFFGEPTTVTELPGGTSWESSSAALILTFISICVLTPISEELLFRGYILDALNRLHGKWPAIIISSIIFGLVHFDPFTIGMATIGGVIYGWIRIRTGSLVPGIVAHAMWNTMALMVTYL
jgi:membrane protease YdiL (CAAX protease family)|tara:strand:- start:489 stop:1286 length:798 start_codon:yes stop_codon:yes gene_type:complete